MVFLILDREVVKNRKHKDIFPPPLMALIFIFDFKDTLKMAENSVSGPIYPSQHHIVSPTIIDSLKSCESGW